VTAVFAFVAAGWHELEPGHIQVGGCTWSHSVWWAANWGADDEDEPYWVQTCVTCGGDIDEDDRHWICDDNSEAVHECCEIPEWDEV